MQVLSAVEDVPGLVFADADVAVWVCVGLRVFVWEFLRGFADAFGQFAVEAGWACGVFYRDPCAPLFEHEGHAVFGCDVADGAGQLGVKRDCALSGFAADNDAVDEGGVVCIAQVVARFDSAGAWECFEYVVIVTVVGAHYRPPRFDGAVPIDISYVDGDRDGFGVDVFKVDRCDHGFE